METTKVFGMSADWWVAGSTVVLTLATIVLGAFTAMLWIATRRAVEDSAAGLAIARDTAAASQKQAEVAERVGMIQNVDALHGHLRYIASCALYGTRPSDAALQRVPESRRGFGRLLHRLEWRPAGDVEARSLDAILNGSELNEASWETLIPSPHLDDFFSTASGIVEIAEAARVAFLVDERVKKALMFRDRLDEWRVEISRLQHHDRHTP